MNESETITLLAINKYTRRLTCALYPQLYAGIRQIWNTSKSEAKGGQVKDTFQQHLKLIPRWNQDLIDKVYRSVLDQLPLRLPGVTSHNAAKMLEDLIARVLLLNTEVMASPFSDGTKIPVKVPPPDRFVHSCYKHCARAFYAKHYLMEDRPQVTSRDRQARNSVEANDTIIRCIEDAIEELVPLDNLLSQGVPSTQKRDPSQTPQSRSRSRGRSPGPAPPRSKTPSLFDTDDDAGNATDEAEAALRDQPSTHDVAEPDAWDVGQNPRDTGKTGGDDGYSAEGRQASRDATEDTVQSTQEDTLTVRFGDKQLSSSDDEGARRSRSRESRSIVPRPKRSAKSTINPADLPPLEPAAAAKPHDGPASPTEEINHGRLPSLETDVSGMDYYDDF